LQAFYLLILFVLLVSPKYSAAWPSHKLPPALKVHQTVLDFFEKNHTPPLYRSEEGEGEGEGKGPELGALEGGLPEADMLVVKFAFAHDSREEMEDAFRQAAAAWAGPAALASPFQMDETVSRKSLGTAAWGKLLATVSAAAAAKAAAEAAGDISSSPSSCTLEEMSSDVVFYREYVELRHVDRFLRRGGDRAKHCLAQLVHQASSDSRVVSVTAQSIPRLLNYLARGICQSGESATAPLSAAGLTGAGEIVGVADSGLNDGSCYFWDNSGAYNSNRVARRSIGSTYVEGNRRKVIQYVSYADGADEVGGHGTHVVGTILGSSTNSDYAMANGVAPDAKVAFVDIQNSDSPYLSVPDIDSQLLSTMYGAGARVFSNSWGGFASKYYSERCSDADNFLYNNPETLVLFAAGNSGAAGFDSLYSPCDSKNILCVGSSDSRSDATDESGSAKHLSHFSSMGPSFDGRLKPDVVGPGFTVVSAMSGTTGSQSCGAVDMFGTSMATPAVAGTALLVREYFRTIWATVCRQNYQQAAAFTPSGVLTKCIIAHSAYGLDTYSTSEFDSRTEEKSFSLGDTPDEFQGFGNIAVGNVLAVTSAQMAQKDLYVTDMFFVKSSSQYEMTVHVDSFDAPLRVTLVWYDPASSVGASKNLLINDLDLEVLTPDGNLYLGNGQADRKNTIEQVTIARTDWEDSGDFTVRVSSGVLSGGNAQYVAVAVTCNGYVSQELVLRSARRLAEKSNVGSSGSVATFLKPQRKVSGPSKLASTKPEVSAYSAASVALVEQGHTQEHAADTHAVGKVAAGGEGGGSAALRGSSGSSGSGNSSANAWSLQTSPAGTG
jgi:hypothetical protein